MCTTFWRSPAKGRYLYPKDLCQEYPTPHRNVTTHTIMKALLFALIALAAASEASGSSKDRIIEMYPYEPTTEEKSETPKQAEQTTPPDERRPEASVVLVFTDYSTVSKETERRLRDLEKKFAPRHSYSSSAMEVIGQFKFTAKIRDETSMLYNVADRFVSTYELYRDLKGGVDTTVLSQDVTVYVQSRLVWKVSRHEKIEFKWSGMKSISYSRAF